MIPIMQTSIALVSDSKQVGALAHPMRSKILEGLRTPDTAAGLARSFGRSRQSVRYHLKALERVGLIEHAGERRKGNFVEQLYQAIATRFIVSSEFASNPKQLASVFRDQASLSQLVELGERLQRDAAGLIELAASEGRVIPSASVESEVRFKDEAMRSAFMSEFIPMLKVLLAKYGGSDGPAYRVALVTYPELEEET
jgi:DNA-binding transcriptional ArsR family regulator